MIIENRGGHNRKKINENFFKLWCPKMAYVLGFIYADGSLLNTNKSSRTYYLSFSNNDYPLLEKIREALESEHRIYFRGKREINYRNHTYMAKPSYVLRIGSKTIYQDLIEIGLQHKKSRIMTLPEIPRKYFCFFLRGYFDGDGCINWCFAKMRNYPSIRVLFSSGSKAYLEKIGKYICTYMNIKSYLIQNNDTAHNLIFQGASAVIVLQNIYHSLSDVPYLEYKYAKYSEYSDKYLGPRIKKSIEMN